MATLTVRTKIDDTLADVTSVALSDPTGAYGLRQGADGAIVVADGEAMTHEATGVYTYEVALPTQGVEYRWWAEILYGGETYHVERTHYESVTVVEVELTGLDEVLDADTELYLEEFGEPVTVNPPGGTPRSCTGVVTRQAQKIAQNPRQPVAPTSVQLPNSNTSGIAAAEWSDRWTVTLPRIAGATATVTMRTLRAVHSDGAMITWEVG